jgi:hypothetical protein
MSGSAKKAEQLMLSSCLAITYNWSRVDPQMMWRQMLAECLPSASGCGSELLPIWVAADAFVKAPPGKERDGAKFRLQIEMRDYLQMRVARSYEAFRGVDAGGV